MKKAVWLSHVLEIDGPAYGGESIFSIKKQKQLLKGDTCNTSELQISNHFGSHVDVPNHFLHKGKTVSEYQAIDWIFGNPLLIDIVLQDAEILTIQHLEKLFPNQYLADIILFRTGFENFRKEERYWKTNPGFSPELPSYLLAHFPNLKAVGMDSISLTSYQHREIGKAAHINFLSADIRIFEDLSLSQLRQETLKQVIALPLRFEQADGAPCTVIGFIDG